MNFLNSKEISQLIISSDNILLCLHQSPDPDSIVSNLLMSKYLDRLGKKYKIVCFDNIPDKFKTTYKTEDVVVDNLSVESFDINEFDLFISLDVNEPIRCGFSNDIKFRSLINIDHHGTENTFSGLKINDSSYSSTSEMLFYFLEDVNYSLSKDEADLVLMGIVTDTDAFSYAGDSRVFRTVSMCVDLGASYEKASEIIYRNNSVDQLKFWGEALKRIRIDKKNRFAYTSIDIKTLKKFSGLLQSNRTVADKFIRTIEGTDFGMAMVESDGGYLKISVRSRSNDYNVMPLLKMLNGGGHFSGGGGRIDLPYKEAVKEAVKIARKFAKSKLQENEKSI